MAGLVQFIGQATVSESFRLVSEIDPLAYNRIQHIYLDKARLQSRTHTCRCLDVQVCSLLNTKQRRRRQKSRVLWYCRTICHGLLVNLEMETR